MSKSKILSTIMAGLFPNSEKAISEKLSTEEHASFSDDVNELNTRLEAQTAANELVTADLTAANSKVAELTGQLATVTALAESRAAEITTITAQRDTFKAHYDTAAKQGSKSAKEDENSRGTVELSSYNAHAQEVFAKAHGK